MILSDVDGVLVSWIEDHAENYDFGFQMGLKSILMDQPWNIDYEEVKDTRVKVWHGQSRIGS